MRREQQSVTNGAQPNQVVRPQLNETQVAEILNVSVKTLRRWRLLGQGPRFRKFGAAVRYDPLDVSIYIGEAPTGGGRAAA